MSKSKQITKFAIAGEVTGLSFKDGDRIKCIQLHTYKGDIWIKVRKELRPVLSSNVTVGETVWVEGEKLFNWKNGQVKLKASSVTPKPLEKALLSETEYPIAFEPLNAVAVGSNNPPSKSGMGRSKSSILVCQKSDCQKRGSQHICRLLEDTLRDRGLDEHITIKKVGCIKQCKSGPHMVLMPDKTRYSRLKPSRVPELIERHFPAPERERSA